jgi:hypothetical protein
VWVTWEMKLRILSSVLTRVSQRRRSREVPLFPRAVSSLGSVDRQLFCFLFGAVNFILDFDALFFQNGVFVFSSKNIVFTESCPRWAVLSFKFRNISGFFRVSRPLAL